MGENCINPSEIQEGDLVAFVDGLADDRVAQHMRRCPACTQEVEEFAAFQATLAESAYRHSCVPAEQLLAYQRGELHGNQYLVVVQHLRQCPHCALELADLAREESFTIVSELVA